MRRVVAQIVSLAWPLACSASSRALEKAASVSWSTLHANLTAQSDAIEQSANLESRHDTAPQRFAGLIESLRLQSNRRAMVPEERRALRCECLSSR